MQSGIKLGRLFGIRIILDWSWLVILFLITWNLAGSYFPSMHPDWSPGLRWGTGLAASLLFFVSILAHELAHSLAAKASGLEVHQIRLFLFGGVSNIEREPATPKADFWISFVGPLTSFLLGAAFLGAGLLGLERPGSDFNPILVLAQMDPFQTLLFWLGPVNLLLAVFNLIPGFPLDGGRVLRSVIWAVTRNFSLATQWAARFGQVVAWLFILAGFAMVFGFNVPLLGRGAVGGIWLAFIGWFLNNAASQSYQQSVITDMLEGVPVSRLMKTDSQFVDARLTIDAVVDQFMLGSDERTFPVIAGDRLAGFLSRADVRNLNREQWPSVTAADIMTPLEQVEVVYPDEDASEALRKLSQSKASQLPVMEQGRLIGVLSQQDIIRWLQLQTERQ